MFTQKSAPQIFEQDQKIAPKIVQKSEQKPTSRISHSALQTSEQDRKPYKITIPNHREGQKTPKDPEFGYIDKYGNHRQGSPSDTYDNFYEFAEHSDGDGDEL